MTRRQSTYAVVACLTCFGMGMFAQTATDIVRYQSGHETKWSVRIEVV